MRPSEWVASIVGVCTILGCVYKLWSILDARHQASKARMDDIQNAMDAYDKLFDEVIYYLSLPEEKKQVPFNSRSAWRTLKRRAQAKENYESRHTSGFE
jgi:DNA-binding protein H-NS